jgi:eukaryotic-like serine/threonine-protein kinase
MTPGGTGRRDATGDSGSSLVGRHLGRYEILALLGTGGMAQVFLARLNGLRGFEKLLALKVMKQLLASDPQYVEMFFHEARVVARLQHPNVVQVLELGQVQGRYYMAMEYLRGVPLGTIEERVEQGLIAPLSPGVVCALIMQACEGLHFAHEATDREGRPLSLVHLDISPQNLLLTTAGALKLIDFGIARSASLANNAAPSPFRGRFSYASPEQLDGTEPDRRSDVFSLGTVFWEMLAGRRLFLGDTPLESIYRISEAPIPSLAALRPDVPSDLDRVVTRALARNPAHRYQSALELFREIGEVASRLGPPVSQADVSRLVTTWFTRDELSSWRRPGQEREAA